MMKYASTKQQLNSACESMKKQSFTYSIMRMTSIVLFIIFLWLAQNHAMFYWFAVFFLLLFFILVYVHEKLKSQLLFQETQLETIEKLEARYLGEWKKEDSLKIEDDDIILNDLDIVGTHSFLDYINMCGTPLGKEYLLSKFKHTASKCTIEMRQHAIEELLHQPNLLLDIQTHSALFLKHSKKIKREIIDQLIEHAKTTINQPIWQIITNAIMVGITLSLIVLSCITSWALHYVFIAISINIIFVLLRFVKNNEWLSEVSAVKDMLEDYQEIMKYIDQVSFQDAYLATLQEKNRLGLKGIQGLLRISQMTRLRSNLITNLICNGVFQIDYFIVYKLSKWKSQYGNDMKDWFMNIAQLEMISSLSVLGQVKEVYCFPTILETETPQMKFNEGYHPLIANAISNNMNLENNTYIITGSNMSGKTTFLRTIGLNAKLALLGAPVCAKECQISLLDIYTSMRIKDDVNEGISTFYAELLSIKKMMDATKKKRPMMVFIDEIFKGTNSADRILCAKEAIHKLHLPWVTTIVSTHDFELCALDQEQQIKAKNYHFEEFYEHDEIHFDYQLRLGKCTTTNAKELMRLAGF